MENSFNSLNKKFEVAGFAGIVVGYPFDTIKVRLQGDDAIQKGYTNTWQCFKKIIKTESVVGLYKGISAPLYGQILINALVFGVHGNIIKNLDGRSPYAQFAAGCVAGAAQSFVCSPMELIKIRLQMQTAVSKASDSSLHKYRYTNTMDCIRKIYTNENGIKGLCRGLHATLWREVPSFGVYFSSYYYLCDKTGALYSGDVKLARLLFCGGIAGILSWVSTYPYDVIKTRQQADGINGHNIYHGIFDCAKKSYKQDGIFVFFRGFNVTLVRAFPSSGATLATVSVFLDYCKTNEIY